MALELSRIDGIKTPDLQKLRENGIVNVMALASATVLEVSSVGIKEERARKFIEQAAEMMNEFMGGKDGFVSGDDLLKQFEKREILTTGCPSFDDILDGGFETQKVYEVYGKEGTGKSSLMHQLVCLSHLPKDKGGLASPATIYIDTENSFSIKRLKAMAPYYHLEPIELVKSVIRANPPTSDALVYLCEKNLNKAMEESGAGLIVLDSLATHFRSEYGDARHLLPQRQRKANRCVHALKKAATIFNAVVVMTNQATANVNVTFGPTYSHAMGLLIGHEAQVRIRIAPGKGGLKELKIEKAVDLPNESCLLKLTQFGLLEEDIFKEWEKNHRKKGYKPKNKQEEEETGSDELGEYEEIEEYQGEESEEIPEESEIEAEEPTAEVKKTSKITKKKKSKSKSS